ncbi:F-box protein At3g07870 [Rosa chinensis]|nr:F-box protein At3g07870 [Rosa chinensis]
MKRCKLRRCHSPSPSKTNGPLKPEVNEEPNAEEPQQQNDQHAEEPYILQVPDYIIFEILSRIPITTMNRCRFVCKSWLRLFSDPSFTKTLCCRTPTSLVVVSSTPSRDYYLVGLDEASRPNGDVLELCSYSRECLDIIGSFNGFLFLYDSALIDDHRLYLSNPITRERLALPKYDGLNIDTNLGFGFSPASNVYKVFVFKSEEENGDFQDEYNEEEVVVLTVGSSVWRNIGKYSVYFGNTEYGFPFNGFLHWVGRANNLVWGFDVERELFQQFPPLPLTSEDTILLDSSDSRLAALRASLCLIVTRGQKVSVWVMKDHGVKGSWNKEFEILNESFDRYIPQLLKFTEGQVLLLRDAQLETHSPGKKGFSMVEVDGIPKKLYSGYVHIPSFISLADIRG